MLFNDVLYPVVPVDGLEGRVAVVHDGKFNCPVIVGEASVCPVAVVMIVPLAVGNVSVVVPDTAGAVKVTVPEVSPATTMLAIS
jgi:hypothetical protein